MRFEPRENLSGRVAQAWDTVFLRHVAVKTLPEGLTGGGSGAALLAGWERWHAAPHPGLLRPAQLDFAGNRLVREWVNGFTLLELLRQRRRLSGSEALALLASAAATLDHLAAHGLLRPGLDKWFVAFPEEPAVAVTPSDPLERWPAWQVRIDPLRLADLVAAGHDRTAHHLAVERPGVQASVTAALEGLRELLGGSRSRSEAPLSALSDEQNRLLATARQPGAFASATEFLRALFRASDLSWPEPAAVLSRERASEDPSRLAALPGERLRLEPAGPGARPLQLIRRAELRLGRSATHADVVLRFADVSPAGLALLPNLSRVHARLQEEDGELLLLDGKAGVPSSNGTFTREGPLRDPGGVRLERLMMAQFGSHWRGTLAPMRGRASRSWEAVFILPAKGCAVEQETVWLLQEAGFGIGEEGSLVWDTEGLSTAPAAFCNGSNSIRLLNRCLPADALTIDGQPLAAGSEAVLSSGARLAIGQDAWMVRVD